MMKAILTLLLCLSLAACNTGWGPDAHNLTTREAPLGEDGSIDCRCWLVGCWSLRFAGLAGEKMTTVPDPDTKMCHVISVREEWLRKQPQAW